MYGPRLLRHEGENGRARRTKRRRRVRSTLHNDETNTAMGRHRLPTPSGPAPRLFGVVVGLKASSDSSSAPPRGAREIGATASVWFVAASWSSRARAIDRPAKGPGTRRARASGSPSSGPSAVPSAMETPDGPDGSCAGDAPRWRRARRRPRLRPRPATPPPPPPPPSPSRGACTRACRACSAARRDRRGSATSDASASARDTTPDADDGGWFNPEAFTVEKRQWLAAAARASAVGPRPTEADRGWATGTRRDASRVGERARDALRRRVASPRTRTLRPFPHRRSSHERGRQRRRGVRARRKSRARGGCRSFRGRPRRRREHRGPAGKPTRPRCSSRTRSTVPVRSTTSSRFASRTA